VGTGADATRSVSVAPHDEPASAAAATMTIGRTTRIA